MECALRFGAPGISAETQLSLLIIRLAAMKPLMFRLLALSAMLTFAELSPDITASLWRDSHKLYQDTGHHKLPLLEWSGNTICQGSSPSPSAVVSTSTSSQASRGRFEDSTVF